MIQVKAVVTGVLKDFHYLGEFPVWLLIFRNRKSEFSVLQVDIQQTALCRQTRSGKN
jgi:hypothetical protein